MPSLTTHHILYQPNPTPRRSARPHEQNRPASVTAQRRRGAAQNARGIGSLRIPPLYRELLTALFAAGYMRSDQIVAMVRILAAQNAYPLAHKALVRVVQKRLRALWQGGVLRRILPPVYPDSRSGPPFAIYALDKAGAVIAAEQMGVPYPDLAWRPAGDESQLFLHHTLQLVDLRILFAEACLQQQIEVGEWIDDRLLRKEPARVALDGEDGQRVQVRLVPDAYYQLKLASGHTLAACLELDRGTSTLAPTKWQARSFRRKVLAYRQLMNGGRSPALWSAQDAVVTTVTTSPSRLAHLQHVCENAGGDHRFWFATRDKLTADTLLTAAVWRVAGKGEQRYRLLPPG